ncbi:hypothetical protein A9J40_19850 [Stenotrophomonas maltophilia]|nr:hypothetical protein A9K70_17645 [Stenotrophomonas maltophilia]OBU60263.1 hypothetical protein A9J40_19850 [Stenotrophomonas maltophilia]
MWNQPRCARREFQYLDIGILGEVPVPDGDPNLDVAATAFQFPLKATNSSLGWKLYKSSFMQEQKSFGERLLLWLSHVINPRA